MQHTFSEYIQFSEELYAEMMKHRWRKGQCYFNQLLDSHPQLAEKIRGADIDPFHRDSCIPDFLEYLQQNWE